MRISDWVSDVCSSDLAGAKCVVVARSSPAPRRRSTPASVNANAPATFGSESSSKTEVVASATPARKPTRLVQGQVYSYTKDGVRHYTRKRPKGVEGATALRTSRYSFLETCFACASSPGVSLNKQRLNHASQPNDN